MSRTFPRFELRRFCVLSFVAVFSSVACDKKSSHIETEIRPKLIIAAVDNMQEEQSVSLFKGQLVEVQLRTQSGTGYVWRLVSNSDDKVVRQKGEPTMKATQTADPAMQSAPVAGGEAWTVFSFKAHKPGDATLEFAYERPWEKSAAPARRFMLKVGVTP